MEIALVIGIVVMALLLFITEKLPVDLVALLILSCLLIFGLVTTEEGLSGFSSAATITVGAMFVLSAGLRKTGIVDVLGYKLLRYAHTNWLLTLIIILVIGVISAFINNTAAVAVLLPTLLTVCAKEKIAPSKLLIPLSYASQFGGVCTLIGTSTNLLVSAISDREGYGAFNMFEFAQLGIIMFVAGTIYFLLFGKWVLPDRSQGEITESYGLGEYITELRVKENSPLIGKNLRQSDLGKRYDASVLEIRRDNQKIWALAKYRFAAGDVLLVRCQVDALLDLKTAEKLESAPDFKLGRDSFEKEDRSLLEVIISPSSNLRGKTLAEVNFQKRYDSIVIAVRRREETLRTQLNRVQLKVGDELLIVTPTDNLAWLKNNQHLLVLKEFADPTLNTGKLPYALSIVGGVVLLAACGVLPILSAAIIGCVLLVLSKCLSMDEAYQSIDWRVVFLLAGVLPLGVAMETSGLVSLIVDNALNIFGDLGPVAFLCALYLLTAVLTEMISNNAAAVLLAPIAISAATTLGVDPKPFLMAVCFAASTSFATPVGYQTNTMIYTPGGYKFSDFMKAGIPLNIIFWIIATIMIPFIWPF